VPTALFLPRREHVLSEQLRYLIPLHALHYRAAHTLVYCALDPLHLDGRDLTATPPGERRDALANVLTGSRLLRSEPLPGTPEQIEKAVREFHLEGVVAKRRNSRHDERCWSRKLKGNLAAMLGATVQSKRSPETGDLLLQVSMVAGARKKLYRQLCWVAA